MNPNSKIYIAGHRGLAGSAIVRELQCQGYTNLAMRTHAELDLEDAAATQRFFEQERPEMVFLAAAKVGGIHANNTYPVDFLLSNLLVEASVCRAAHATGVKRLIFLGSSCIYSTGQQTLTCGSDLASQHLPTTTAGTYVSHRREIQI